MHQRDILKALHGGAVIRVEVGVGAAGVMHRLSSNNKPVPWTMVEKLLKAGLIRACEDGLPGMGVTQSYVLWRASEGGA